MLLISVVGFILYCIESSVHHLIGYFSIFPIFLLFDSEIFKENKLLGITLAASLNILDSHDGHVRRPSLECKPAIE